MHYQAICLLWDICRGRSSSVFRLSLYDFSWSIGSWLFHSKVEGVPALIQQWEVSWDDTLDPAVSYKIGQVGNLQLWCSHYWSSPSFSCWTIGTVRRWIYCEYWMICSIWWLGSQAIVCQHILLFSGDYTCFLVQVATGFAMTFYSDDKFIINNQS